jgi:glutathione synthase
MRIGVLVNDIRTETPRYTTTAIVRAARMRGHEAFFLGTGDFVLEDDRLEGWLREAGDPEESAEVFLERVKESATISRMPVDELDVLLLRNNPHDDLRDRSWAAQAGLVFGEEAQRRGVLVQNDPAGLARAMSKLYLERFPASVRPASLVTRHVEDLRAFVRQYGTVVVKPLNGSGGKRVFVVREDGVENTNQIFEAVTELGYALAQEYLPAAREGDVRLVLMNGRPLERGGRFAALRRVGSDGDLRNNIIAGARAEPIEPDDELLELAAIVGPRLVEDGLWLVGLDAAGGKILELNVWSTGGLVAPSVFYGVDFAAAVVEDLERQRAQPFSEPPYLQG